MTGEEEVLFGQAADAFEEAARMLDQLAPMIRAGDIITASPIMRTMTNKIKSAGATVHLAYRLKEMGT